MKMDKQFIIGYTRKSSVIIQAFWLVHLWVGIFILRANFSGMIETLNNPSVTQGFNLAVISLIAFTAWFTWSASGIINSFREDDSIQKLYLNGNIINIKEIIEPKEQTKIKYKTVFEK